MATLDTHIPPNTPHAAAKDAALSSSPAFATPLHPIRPHPPPQPQQVGSRHAPILPILLPPATLRPIAFRTFTKKHNLNLTAPALQLLATFVGKHCGASWREEGLGELVLEEVAKCWKRAESNLIVDGSESLKNILKQLEGNMSGGRITDGKRGSLSRQDSLNRLDAGPGAVQRQESFGISALEVEDDGDDDSETQNPRQWLKVIDAFDQPRLIYNAARKHFQKSTTSASFFPPPSRKTDLFRQRYQLIHQRVLRNESFQAPTVSNTQQPWKITPIANLLGRSGTGHLLLGLLTISPAGTLAISDLTGSIHLNLEQAASIDVVETWLCPGMIVLVDGVYEEEYNSSGGNLGVLGGVGGTVGGRFIGFSIGAPRCETRAMTVGTPDSQNLSDLHIGGGFGWVDFLGLGSERAMGSRMRRIEQRLLGNDVSCDRINSNKVVFIGDCNLDNPQTLSALRRVLTSYNPSASNNSTTQFTSTPPPSEPTIPLAFVLMGNFATHAAMSATSTSSYSNSSSTHGTSAGIPDSITYKESFDALALLLSDFPALLRHSTWVFVPGDNDPWPSAFSAGGAVPLPRQGIPEMFTSRLRRAFAAANTDTVPGGQPGASSKKEERVKGDAVWTSNPSRLSLFGPSCEIVVFRDDVTGRLRRNAIPLKAQVEEDGQQDLTSVDQDVSTQHRDDEAEVFMSGALQEPEDSLTDTNIGNNTTDQTQIDLDAMDTDEPNADASHQQSKTPNSKPTTSPAQSLAKTLLDQSTLSPFPLNIRPLHWDYAPSALGLYPLPSALALCDADVDPFALIYQGCAVLNAGSVAGGLRGGSSSSAAGAVTARWVEFDVRERKGCVREA